jgi:tyrosyl-tRNA synthetase
MEKQSKASVLELIARGTVEILPENDLEEKIRSGRTLRIKAGFDPTAPDIHLGHTVLINKLKLFQDLGHQIYLLIGDFTAKIGDPTGKSSTRPPLSDEEIAINAETYAEQVFKILDREKTKIVYNSSWLGSLSAADLIRLASGHTVARMLERDDFEKRYKGGTPIAIHEFLYPMLQGYDSVEIKADVEMGGTDQKFNLLMGREMQKLHGQPEQTIITTPILEGLDGVQKMSKSLNNYIGVNEEPNEMFGKLMSLSDELMWRYFELLSFRPTSEIAEMQASVEAGANPRDIKFQLGIELVDRFHGAGAGEKARLAFVERFQKNQIPEEIAEITVHCNEGETTLGIAQLLKESGLVTSTSEGMRMVQQGAVRRNGEKIEDKGAQIARGEQGVYQVGKRKFAKVTVA